MSDSNEWHYNYNNVYGNLSVWEAKHRPHLFLIGANIFKNLCGLITGPFE